jgi:DNA-binding FadR family transcriptional regulator
MNSHPPSFKKIDAAPVYRLVSEAIERQIVSGVLKPGDLLPTETQLADQFGINRSSVREGIRLLEETGLVRRRSGKRLEITLPPIPDTATRATRVLRLHEVTFRELWEASTALEPVAARYAAGRITPAETDLLAANIAAMEAASDDPDEVVRLDMAFHDIIGQATRNRALMMAREPVVQLFMPAGRAILPRLRTQSRIVQAHRAILAALAAHDAAEAEGWMLRHMQDFRRGFERTGLDLDKPLGPA